MHIEINFTTTVSSVTSFEHISDTKENPPEPEQEWKVFWFHRPTKLWTDVQLYERSFSSLREAIDFKNEFEPIVKSLKNSANYGLIIKDPEGKVL